MKLRFAASVAGFALLASSLTASAASIILGDFNVEQYVEANPRQGQVSSSEVYSPSAVKVGGYRSLSVTNANGRTGGTSLESADGYLDFSNSARTSGTGTVLWDGIGSTGLGGVDLTDGGTNNALFLDVIFADANLTLSFSVTDTAGFTSTISKTVAESLLEPTSLSFLFSDFSGSANFSSLNSISLILTGTTQGLDASIDTVYAASTLPAVPLPAAGWLMVGGLAALGVMKRRKS
ncbi:VPLPA-CTERM sorting domain-containing protein [Paenirhodobacter populi]|uniref:VPLPA-CTERM sorting domain-containing protein n=1 Tax=Paenirhodobacter populi TaxID=2306993 RepID=A0A443JDY0_9RHOB|nr:VPLPA-CTERM sorting domain-containing protein [Sinirhodobacter populi]RWR06086.1 VPLPA-CTERM sorting domain-containing protein [Sinirhodobacter populi]RWR18702.1 VPLPA-CTERM sorting domain-containing protein [Sinirhodobacter populi]